MTAHASDADASGDDGSPPEFVPLEDEDAAARAWEDPSPDGALTMLLEAAESARPLPLTDLAAYVDEILLSMVAPPADESHHIGQHRIRRSRIHR